MEEMTMERLLEATDLTIENWEREDYINNNILIKRFRDKYSDKGTGIYLGDCKAPNKYLKEYKLTH